MFRELDSQVLVADAPMRPRDMADVAARGVTLAINNRPDHEESGQVSAADLERAARAAGMDYAHIPVRQDFTEDMIASLSEALAGAEGRVLVFCKTGTRSTFLWALTRAGEGAVPEALSLYAARAGYDLRPLMNWLRRAGAAPE